MSASTSAGVERKHRPGRQRRRDREHGRQEEEHLVGAGRDDDLLHHQLDRVGDRLQQPPEPTRFGPMRTCI